MTDWKVSMLILLPLMWKPAQWRTWAALMSNSVAASIFPFVIAYVFIDGISAAFVLKRPRGLAQRAIGLLFAGMVLSHVGFLLSPQASELLHWKANMLIGWLQLACLLLWGASNVGEYLGGGVWSGTGALDRRNGV